MVNIRKIRVGTKFLVTYAIPDSGMKKGQIVKVDSKRFGIPGINGYLINKDLGFGGFAIRSIDGIVATLKQITNHLGCPIKTIKAPTNYGKLDNRRIRRLARNALKFRGVGDDFYYGYKRIARNAGK